jgi:hypothetical protein
MLEGNTFDVRMKTRRPLSHAKHQGIEDQAFVQLLGYSLL